MGVIGNAGVVGKVKSVSKHFATVISLLHTDGYVSSIIKGSGTFGTVKWGGTDPGAVNLLFVPRHLKINAGDTIVSSGFSAIYPYGILIGFIKGFEIQGNAAFYDIKVDLATDFSNLSFVYVVKNALKTERDSLELKTSIP
jgi:rod shape-determining protein MreC